MGNKPPPIPNHHSCPTLPQGISPYGNMVQQSPLTTHEAKTVPIKALMTIHTKSIRLKQIPKTTITTTSTTTTTNVPSSSQFICINFNYDAHISGFLSIYFLNQPPKVYSFLPGTNQTFLQPEQDGFLINPSSLTKALLACQDDHSVPLKIILSIHNPTNQAFPTTNSMSSLSVFCELSQQQSNQPQIHIESISQRIRIGTKSLDIQDLYGLECKKSSVHQSLSEQLPVNNDSQSEVQDHTHCVICLEATRDTCLLPCRHMCLCYECANELTTHSDLCPMCRIKFSSFLRLNLINEEQRTESCAES